MAPMPGDAFPHLAPSEWRIFLVLGLRGPLTLREIGTELARRDPEFGSAHATLSTLLKRLCAKGYVRQEAAPERNMPHLFTPLVPLDLALKSQVDRFLFDYTQNRSEVIEMVLNAVQEHLEEPPRRP